MAQRKPVKKLSKSFGGTKGKLPTLVTVPMPSDTISGSYISAGWLLSQMDLAAGGHSYKHIGGRSVTVGVEAMSFRKPVFVGDDVRIYTRVVRQGKTSVSIKVESWASRRYAKTVEKVTEGTFTFVAIDVNHRPVEIKRKVPAKLKNKPAPARSPQNGPLVLQTPPNLPDYALSIRTIPLPRDTNYLGDIFGGWILSQMDLACKKEAEKYINMRAATVGLESMTFHKPIHVGDEVSLYVKIVRTGNTSIALNVQSWALRAGTKDHVKVTEGTFTFVAFDANHNKTPIGPRP